MHRRSAGLLAAIAVGAALILGCGESRQEPTPAISHSAAEPSASTPKTSEPAALD
jgi:hypothetical protein